MKPFLISILATVAALSGCQKQPLDQIIGVREAKSSAREEKAGAGAGDAVQLKEGRGLALHPKIRAAIGLQLADVGEEAVAPEIKADLHVIQGADSIRKVALTPGSGSEANGWLRAEIAARIKIGQEAELRVDAIGGATVEKGLVKRLEKSPYVALGDVEVVVGTAASLDTGTRLRATFRAPAGDPVTAVPRAALLRTATGWFVYTVNENFFLRTPVKIGAMNSEFAEITDGLYAGDQIVTSPVNTLWMAELQILRGGKSCTCGR